MFSQSLALRKGQQPINPIGSCFTNQLQMQQNRSISQTQYEKNEMNQLMASTKRLNESFGQDQQINDVYRILDQLQQFVILKFNDFQNVLSEQERTIKPLIEQNTQLNTQLNSVLQQSEKVLQQLTLSLEKSEQQNKRGPKRKNSDENQLGTVQQLLSNLDDRLNHLSDEVELIAESNNRFQVQVLEVVNVDKIEHRENLQRVLTEMDKAKKSLSKKLKR